MQRELQILDTSSTDGNVKNKKRVFYLFMYKYSLHTLFIKEKNILCVLDFFHFIQSIQRCIQLGLGME